MGKLRAPDAQVDLFVEDQAPAKRQRIADWGTPEQHARARALMFNLGERWGDRYAGQETMTYDEWRQRRLAVCWKILDGLGEEKERRPPMITAEEERLYKARWTAVHEVGRV